ncbi:hypothetical protein G5I_11739 [Acromyrmex echinatior]|uniref:Uncharacterized protein n=1 Tax=Acromyrmex echinatior TaxID=103372 RepID=F4X0E7_ACREC|nr:hypothetical protein G5I_11739 [Acromyrmex echinatior]
MIDDRQLSPERSPEEVHLPNRGHGRHGVRANRIPPLSPLRRKRCRAEPVRSSFAAVSSRLGYAYQRTSKKQKEYKDDNLRLSPFAQRIDFTGFHERTQEPDRPTDRSLRPFRFFPLSSPPLPSPLPPLVLTSGRDRKRSRAALRVYRKKGRADRRCSGLCLKTNEHRTARSSSRNKCRDKKAEVDLGPNGSFSATEYANARSRENDGAQERETEKERGGRQHRVTSAEPIFGSAKCKQNDRPVMHRSVWRKSSNSREQGGPIPAVPAHARIISAGQGIFITWGPSRFEQMLDEAAV